MAQLVDGAAVTHMDAHRGNGVVATSALQSGTRLFEELPLIAIKHRENIGVDVCQQCFRFLGPLEAQINGLLSSRGSAVSVSDPLPTVPGLLKLPHSRSLREAPPSFGSRVGPNPLLFHVPRVLRR